MNLMICSMPNSHNYKETEYLPQTLILNLNIFAT